MGFEGVPEVADRCQYSILINCFYKINSEEDLKCDVLLSLERYWKGTNQI